jgi:hypothetical protein
MNLHLAFTVLFASYLASCDAFKQLRSLDQEDAESSWNSGFDGRSLTSYLDEAGVGTMNKGTGKTGKYGTTPTPEPQMCSGDGENCTDPDYECVCACPY